MPALRMFCGWSEGLVVDQRKVAVISNALIIMIKFVEGCHLSNYIVLKKYSLYKGIRN